MTAVSSAELAKLIVALRISKPTAYIMVSGQILMMHGISSLCLVPTVLQVTSNPPARS